MVSEVVNTGGSKEFVYRSGHGNKLTKKEKEAIRKAYSKAKKIGKVYAKSNDKPSKENPEELEESEESQGKRLSGMSEEVKKPKKKPKIKKIVFISIILIAIAITLFISWQKGYLEDSTSKIDTLLSENAFLQLNNFRESNNLSKLEKSQNAFYMALFLSKEQFTDGKIYSDSVEQQEIANRFGVKGDFTIRAGSFDESQGFTIDHVISRWKQLSPKEGILNPKYNFGDVACYENVCNLVLSDTAPVALKSDEPIFKKITLESIAQFLGTDVDTLVIILIAFVIVIVIALIFYFEAEDIIWYITSVVFLFFLFGGFDSFDNTQYTTDYNYEFVDSFTDDYSSQALIDSGELEDKIHILINAQRREHELPNLKIDHRLSEIARRHSEDMAQNNYFSHENFLGEDPTARGEKQDYRCFKDYGSYYTKGIAENIFQNNLYNSVTYWGSSATYNWNSIDEIASSTVDGWMNSLGHRRNILEENYDKTGIGVAISSDNKVYITQDFC